MAGIRAVVFDLDDTLYDCSGELVESARRRAAAAMVRAGLPCTEEEAYSVQAELEAEFGPKFDVFQRIAQRYSCPVSIADAALAASLFHYRQLSIGQVKDYLARRGVPVRWWG